MFYHQAGVMPVYWLMLANCCFAYGRCYCHSFCGRCYCHCYVFYWQMLLPYSCWADVIAIVCMLLDWWQMLLPLWLLFLPLEGMLYHSVADVIAILLANVIAMLVCCCVLWQMLLPLWLMVLPFVRMM